MLARACVHVGARALGRVCEYVHIALLIQHTEAWGSVVVKALRY